MTSTTLRNVLTHIDDLWPSMDAEDWDAVGLVTGNHESPIESVLFVVDVTGETVSHAVDGGYDLVIAHHPLLLRGVTTVAEDRFKGDAVARLIRANCGLVSVHTNGDRVESGTTVCLARLFGINDTHEFGGGLGLSGSVGTTTLGDLARRVASVLPATAGGVRVAGDISQLVATVTVCAGAGDSFLNHDAVTASDVYITSDLRHHPASEFRENARFGTNTALIDISHWAAEWVWLDTAAAELRSLLPGVTIDVSDLNTDPWKFVVTQ